MLEERVEVCLPLIALLEEMLRTCFPLVALPEEVVLLEERVGGGSEVAACSFSLNCTGGGLSVEKCSKVHSISTLL